MADEKPDAVTRLRDHMVDAVACSREIRTRQASLEAQNTALAEALRRDGAELERLRAKLTGVMVIFRGQVLTEELERADGDATTEELRQVAAILWGPREATDDHA